MADPGRIYAGIGARATPPEVLRLMTQLAGRMEQDGWRLRSGGARGADAAFETGVQNPSMRAIYLPGRSFNGRRAGPGGYVDATSLPGWKDALQSVADYHVNDLYKQAALEMQQGGGLPFGAVTERRQRYGPQRRRDGSLKSPEEEVRDLAFIVNLQARNGMQMMGPNMDRPADLVVAYTPDGAVQGGTGQALRMAGALGIPIRNLGNPAALASARRYLGLGAA